MKLFGIHARYANATYIAASKKKALPAVERDLSAVSQVRQTVADLLQPSRSVAHEHGRGGQRVVWSVERWGGRDDRDIM